MTVIWIICDLRFRIMFCFRLSALMIEETRSSEKLRSIYQIKWRHIPENSNFILTGTSSITLLTIFFDSIVYVYVAHVLTDAHIFSLPQPCIWTWSLCQKTWVSNLWRFRWLPTGQLHVLRSWHCGWRKYWMPEYWSWVYMISASCRNMWTVGQMWIYYISS
jgi:hypothetical protein